MSKKTDLFEEKVANCVKCYSNLPVRLPIWMNNLGINPNAKIISSNRIGNKNKDNKTDIIVHLDNSTPIKISVKLSSADYFGNWYGHLRFIEEFGEKTFEKLSSVITDWANSWIKESNASPFVGVSICFGRRTGKTAIPFLDIFTPEDIISIVRGYGDECDATANCMYISNTSPSNIDELISNLRPINNETISEAVGQFMIACRPINPMTEGTNRGKNVYTQFIPFKKLNQPTRITTTAELREIGSFHTVNPNKLNHNHILNNLEKNFNLIIPRK
ncbi:hypothetical protein NMZ80_08955 [Clostridioides difficile]|uniref:hypothetical protein n=1 Tax=Clostridioides difficile TaxID=1496 RepID=UPI0021C45D1C|nr:hypothetical protein [Clostridioides difficile]UUC43559.1 hypothetical protein NMZ80_08955 [Clostridioides difficile]